MGLNFVFGGICSLWLKYLIIKENRFKFYLNFLFVVYLVECMFDKCKKMVWIYLGLGCMSGRMVNVVVLKIVFERNVV